MMVPAASIGSLPALRAGRQVSPEGRKGDYSPAGYVQGPRLPARACLIPLRGNGFLGATRRLACPTSSPDAGRSPAAGDATGVGIASAGPPDLLPGPRAGARIAGGIGRRVGHLSASSRILGDLGGSLCRIASSADHSQIARVKGAFWVLTPWLDVVDRQVSG